MTLPVRGFRLIFKGRIGVATANYTSVNPENILNLISIIQITGTNRRQNGNVTPWFIDLATLFAATVCSRRGHGRYVEGIGMKQKDIKSVLLEERSFPPSKEFAAHARLKRADVEALYKHAAADPNASPPSPMCGKT